MIQIKAYNKDGSYAYLLPYEYTDEQVATQRANALNDYWQSPDRVIKGDKLYTVSENHNEVMQAYGHKEQPTESLPAPVPRQFRRTVPVRKRLSSMERFA
ncbi:hypothetical protein [Arthronema virus TR020]|uniref:Uncharacterized protein n=1 Tax=Arthronema virus TR020 TaxID=2736280 RepID=A0A7G3WH19_9CAUD|nr:hypothetical protein [Arthronema virus TR020]